MSQTRTRSPLWTQAGSVIGMIVCMTAIAFSIFRWFDALTYPLIGQHLNEIALHTPDYVTAGDMAMFAASLLVATGLYHLFDSELRHKSWHRLCWVARGIRRTLRT